MSQTAERFLTIITGAAIAGLLILNASGTASVINALGGQAVGYVKAVQGS